MSAAIETRQLIALPTWLTQWPSVAGVIRRIETGEFTGGTLSDKQHLILTRLATNDQMRNVWTLLTSRDRRTGEFAHPALPAGGKRNADENQSYYLALTLYQTFCAAWQERAATKIEDVQALKEKLIHRAKVLREAASDIVEGWQNAINDGSSLVSQRNIEQDLMDAQALVRIAGATEQQASCLRDGGDPLTIKNDRGDPMARGVAITMAAFFMEHFGDRLDGTAATLAGVALDGSISDRSVRSAFSRGKGT